MVEADDLGERAEPRGGRSLGLIAARERGRQHVGTGREFVTRAGTAELDVGPRDHNVHATTPSTPGSISKYPTRYSTSPTYDPVSSRQFPSSIPMPTKLGQQD